MDEFGDRFVVSVVPENDPSKESPLKRLQVIRSGFLDRHAVISAGVRLEESSEGAPDYEQSPCGHEVRPDKVRYPWQTKTAAEKVPMDGFNHRLLWTIRVDSLEVTR